jgi:hypothetical protein
MAGHHRTRLQLGRQGKQRELDGQTETSDTRGTCLREREGFENEEII